MVVLIEAALVRILARIVIRTQLKFVKSFMGSRQLDCGHNNLSLAILANDRSGGIKATRGSVSFDHIVERVPADTAFAAVHKPLPLIEWPNWKIWSKFLVTRNRRKEFDYFESSAVALHIGEVLRRVESNSPGRCS